MRIRKEPLESTGPENFDSELQALHLKEPPLKGEYESIWANKVWICANGWDVGTVNQVQREIFDEGQGED